MLAVLTETYFPKAEKAVCSAILKGLLSENWEKNRLLFKSYEEEKAAIL